MRISLVSLRSTRASASPCLARTATRRAKSHGRASSPRARTFVAVVALAVIMGAGCPAATDTPAPQQPEPVTLLVVVGDDGLTIRARRDSGCACANDIDDEGCAATDLARTCDCGANAMLGGLTRIAVRRAADAGTVTDVTATLATGGVATLFGGAALDTLILERAGDTEEMPLPEVAAVPAPSVDAFVPVADGLAVQFADDDDGARTSLCIGGEGGATCCSSHVFPVEAQCVDHSEDGPFAFAVRTSAPAPAPSRLATVLVAGAHSADVAIPAAAAASGPAGVAVACSFPIDLDGDVVLLTDAVVDDAGGTMTFGAGGDVSLTVAAHRVTLEEARGGASYSGAVDIDTGFASPVGRVDDVAVAFHAVVTMVNDADAADTFDADVTVDRHLHPVVIVP